ncbi:RNA polymerase II transcription factor B subunit 2 [Nymphaea thermarum]|nr:RNA polymerase II transcription factor B subunit 2 [Nymphaea thermarum]
MICPKQIRIDYQAPNHIVGSIAKESLYLAFSKGITAEQNSHPRVATRIPAVLENVTDQVANQFLGA